MSDIAQWLRKEASFYHCGYHGKLLEAAIEIEQLRKQLRALSPQTEPANP